MSPLRKTTRVESSINGKRGGPELGRASDSCCRLQPQSRAGAGWVRAEPVTDFKNLAMASISLNSEKWG